MLRCSDVNQVSTQMIRFTRHNRSKGADMRGMCEARFFTQPKYVGIKTISLAVYDHSRNFLQITNFAHKPRGSPVARSCRHVAFHRVTHESGVTATRIGGGRGGGSRNEEGNKWPTKFLAGVHTDRQTDRKTEKMVKRPKQTTALAGLRGFSALSISNVNMLYLQAAYR